MTRKVSYPKFVDIPYIRSHEVGNYRHWLKIPFKNCKNQKILCVILKNPSKANNDTCDNTVSRVCNVAKEHGYSEVIILNLFPFRTTNPKGLLNFYNSRDFQPIMACNLRRIIKICKNKDIVFAWGTNTISSSNKNKNIYDLAIKDITSKVTKNIHYVRWCGCSNEVCTNMHQAIRYPCHGLRWKNNSDIIPY